MRPARKEIRLGGRRATFFDEGAGRAMVLLHAFPLDAAMWEPQLGAVPPGWRLVAPDLQGFGGAESSDAGLAAASLDDYADDVLALLDRLGIERAVIGGLSMGGYITFALLGRAQHRIDGVVLADTRPGPDTPDGREGRRKMQALVEAEGAAGLARVLLPKLLAEGTLRDAPEIADRVRAIVEAASPEAIKMALERMLRRPDSTPRLASLALPALIIVGAEDVLTPPGESEAMHRQMPGSVLEILPGAGHLASLERPHEFNAALHRFCAERF